MSLSAPAVKRRLNIVCALVPIREDASFPALTQSMFCKKINCLYCVVMLTVDVCKMKHNKSY